MTLSAPAMAGDYLCGLSRADVEDVIDYYGLAGSFDDYRPYVETPFNCATYGDLCDDLGVVRAEQFVCDRWADGVNHLPPWEIDANASADFEVMNDAWEAEQFPDGIPDDSPWLGSPMMLGSCSRTAYRDDGSHRVVVRARYYSVGLYSRIYTFTKSYDNRGSTTSRSWRFNDSGTVTIDGYFYSLDAYGVCDYWDPGTKTDTDGRVAYREWALGINVWPNENVEGVGTYSGLSAMACNSAPWDHC